MSALDRLSLIQWLSPAFPTGGFAYSHGLEQAMSEGLRDADAVAGWIADVLDRGGGRTDAVILSLTPRGGDADDLSDLARAICGSAKRLTETMDQGRAFAATVAALDGIDMPPRPLPVAVGLAARRLDLPATEIIARLPAWLCRQSDRRRNALSAPGSGAGATDTGGAASADRGLRRARGGGRCRCAGNRLFRRRSGRHAPRNHRCKDISHMSQNGPLRVGIGGPVGAGKTTLTEQTGPRAWPRACRWRSSPMTSIPARTPRP